MKVVIDADLCQGHTLCALSAPEVFGLGEEDGHACPERAITIVAEEDDDADAKGNGED
jgi:ferredoxin